MPAPTTEATSFESIEADNQLLKQLSAAIIDATAPEAQMSTLWDDESCSAAGTLGR